MKHPTIIVYYEVFFSIIENLITEAARKSNVVVHPDVSDLKEFDREYRWPEPPPMHLFPSPTREEESMWMNLRRTLEKRIVIGTTRSEARLIVLRYGKGRDDATILVTHGAVRGWSPTVDGDSQPDRECHTHLYFSRGHVS